jgi:hypothetical protein
MKYGYGVTEGTGILLEQGVVNPMAERVSFTLKGHRFHDGLAKRIAHHIRQGRVVTIGPVGEEQPE